MCDENPRKLRAASRWHRGPKVRVRWGFVFGSPRPPRPEALKPKP